VYSQACPNPKTRTESLCPKGQPIDMGYPAHTQFSFFAKRIVFQNNGSFFLLGCCLCVSLPSTTEGGFFQYGPDYGTHPTPASASGRHKLRTMCYDTWQHVPQNTLKHASSQMRCETREHERVSVRIKKHPLRVRVMQTDAHRVNNRHERRFFANAILYKSYVKQCSRSEL
jgi:hypothetical protein